MTRNFAAFPAARTSAAPTPLHRPAASRTAELARAVRDLAGRHETWAPRVRMPETDRWWTRLSADDDLDVWLLTWLPGQSTELHDHGSSAAAFTVVQGVLEEVRATVPGRHTTLTRGLGATARIASGAIHDVRAVAGRPAVSIHAYSPPLRSMNYWAPGEDGRLRIDHTVVSDEPERVSA
jgi:predicted metal-dependent enzyme (double-stranded beta helix superfamily)